MNSIIEKYKKKIILTISFITTLMLFLINFLKPPNLEIVMLYIIVLIGYFCVTVIIVYLLFNILESSWKKLKK